MFTGSGFPQRFADIDGSMIDVYQATTQITDESGQSIPTPHRGAARQGAGQQGYYGVVHDQHAHRPSRRTPAPTRSSPRRQARGVPVVSARQMLDWLDGRNASSFGGLGYGPRRAG